VVKFRPKDKDARLKYTECKKIVQKQAFEKAIAVDHEKKSLAESLDVNSIGKCLTVSIRKLWVHRDETT
jgi:serine/threonine-protein phosphatase 5